MYLYKYLVVNRTVGQKLGHVVIFSAPIVIATYAHTVPKGMIVDMGRFSGFACPGGVVVAAPLLSITLRRVIS